MSIEVDFVLEFCVLCREQFHPDEPRIDVPATMAIDGSEPRPVKVPVHAACAEPKHTVTGEIVFEDQVQGEET